MRGRIFCTRGRGPLQSKKCARRKILRFVLQPLTAALRKGLKPTLPKWQRRNTADVGGKRSAEMQITSTMSAALEAIQVSGVIIRHPGGHWWAGEKEFCTSTVVALIFRGLLKYTKWHEGRRGTFPVEAALLQPPTAKGSPCPGSDDMYADNARNASGTYDFLHS